MSEQTLDQAERELLTEEVADEALEAATGTDQGPRGSITFAPIWCPDSVTR